MSTSGPKPPAPVEVTNPDPIPVKVEQPADTTAQTTAKTVASSVKADADILRTEDQRRISGMWERTQQIIALSVVEATLLVILIQVARGDPDVKTALAILFGLANLVIGFYFGRTNHQKVGGDSSPRDDAQGR